MFLAKTYRELFLERPILSNSILMGLVFIAGLAGQLYYNQVLQIWTIALWSGLLLGAILQFGIRIVPGFLVGVYAYEGYYYVANSWAQPIGSYFLLCSAVNAVYLAQALITKVLVDHFVARDAKFDLKNDAFLLLFLAGPLASLINAIAGTYALVYFSALEASLFLESALHRWATESVGILFITPILLIAGQRRSSNKGAPPIAVYASTTALFLFIQITLIGAGAIQFAKSTADSENVSSSIAHGIDLKIQQVEQSLVSIRNYFAGSKYVDRREFSVFVRPILNSGVDIVSISWLPVVQDADIPRLVKEANEFGLIGFSVSSVSPEEFVDRMDDSRDLLVYYQEKRKSNGESGLGKKLPITSKFLESTLAALNDGALFTESRELAGIVGSQSSINHFVSVAIYKNGTTTDTSKIGIANLLGILVAEVDMQSLFASAIKASEQKTEKAMLELFSRGSVSDTTVKHMGIWTWNGESGKVSLSVHAHGVDSPEHIQEEKLQKSNTDVHTSVKKAISFFGSKLKLHISHSPAALWYKNDYTIEFILIMCVLFSYLVGSGSITILFYSNSIEQLVEERTSELNEAYKKIRLSNSQLEALFVAFPDAMVRLSKEGIILSYKAQDITQFFRVEGNILGANIARLIPDPVEKIFFESFSKVVSGASNTEIVEFEHRNGEDESQTRTLEARLTDQGAENVLLVMRDITDVKRLQNDLERQRQNSVESARLASMGEMAGGIAHEINNPLAIIQGNGNKIIKLIDKDAESKEEKIVEASEKIVATVSRIAKIIKGLRTVARDGTNDPFEPVSLKQIFDEVVEFCSERLRNNQVGLDIEVEDENQSIDMRRVQLMQVLINLVNNAYDVVKDLDERWIRLKVVSVEVTDIEIRVIDSGNGIPNDIVEKLFQPFFTTKDVGKGTGLGLSISRSIAEAHMGKLEYRLEDGHTCFAIRIPKRQENAVVAEKSKAA